MLDSKKSKEIQNLVREKSFHLESSDFDFGEKIDIRRAVLEKLTKRRLKYISSPSFDIGVVSTKNCENLVGKIEVPLGIAGPIKINGDYIKGEIIVPLATTEGALVASVSRGCKAVNEGGGADVYLEKSGISRAPVFRVDSLTKAKSFVNWVNSHFKEIALKIKETSSHITLLEIKPFIAGRNIFLRFVFDTEDAMGMNMATIACDYVVSSFISKRTDVPCIALSGNLCVDKKASWLNKIEKRGHAIHADVTIPERIVREVLKTTPREFVEVHIRKNLVGSALSGSIGFNSHHANVIAAIFLATGQDMAHVAEASIGMTSAEIVGGDLYVSVDLPDMPVGTIGGGANLGTQKDALSIMGVAGGGKPSGSNSKKLAEIIAAAVLAGEVSLIAALASGDLAKAHNKLGRGRKYD